MTQADVPPVAAGAEAPAGAGWVRRWRDRAFTREAIAWWVLGVGLVGSSVMWLVINSRLWFFYDSWEFILYRGPVPGQDIGIWEPHNEHWSTLPVLLFRALFAMFGLKHHLPYVLPVIVAHVVVCLTIVWIMRRAGLSRWTAVGMGLVLAFLGGGAENLEWEFQIGFVGSAMFGMLALAVLSEGVLTRRRMAVVWALLVAGLMSSGVGVTFVICAAIVALVRAGWLKAMVLAALPAVIYLGWYALYGRHAERTPLEPRSLAKMPEYVWTGLSSAWQVTIGIPGSGVVILFVILGAVLLTGRRQVVALAGTVGAVMQLVITGLVRVQYGVGQATSSRYLYLVCVLTVVALAVAVDALVRRLAEPRWLTGTLLGGLCLAVLLHGVALAGEFLVDRARSTDKSRDTALGTLAVVDSGQKILSDHPDVGFPMITVQGVLAIRDQLPAIAPSPQGYADVASDLLVGQGAPVEYLPFATGTIDTVGLVPTTSSERCRAYTPAGVDEMIAVTIGDAGGRVVLTTSAASISTRLRYGAVAGEVAPRVVTPSSPVSIGTSSKGGILDIMIPAGSSATVCTG